MCAGASMLDIAASLGLRSPYDHAYTSASRFQESGKKLTRCARRSTASTMPACFRQGLLDGRWTPQEALECMDGLGFSAEEKHSVFQLVAAVPGMHLASNSWALRYCTWAT